MSIGLQTDSELKDITQEQARRINKLEEDFTEVLKTQTEINESFSNINKQQAKLLQAHTNTLNNMLNAMTDTRTRIDRNEETMLEILQTENEHLDITNKIIWLCILNAVGLAICYILVFKGGI